MADGFERRANGRLWSRRRFLKTVGAGAAALALADSRLFLQRARAAGIAHPLPNDWLSTKGNQFVAAGNPAGPTYRLAGVNWYGFECNQLVVGGLDTMTLDALVAKIAQFGFNFIRLPFCLDIIYADSPVDQTWLSADSSLWGMTSQQIMDRLITLARNYGLKVILDCHRLWQGWSTDENGLWFNAQYSGTDWLNALKQLATTYANNNTVIGFDLHNEPSSPPPDVTEWPGNETNNGVAASSYPQLLGSTWGLGDPNPNPGIPSTDSTNWNWGYRAEVAGNALLAINPNLLIIVEGTRYDPEGTSATYTYLSRNEGNHPPGYYWPGGNLLGVRHGGTYTLNGVSRTRTAGGKQINLNVANKLVFSAHDYGPSYATLPWCDSSTAGSSSACTTTWDAIWGGLHKGYYDSSGVWRQYPVLLGEFGTENGYQHWYYGDPIVPTDTPQNQYTDANNSMGNIQGNWFTYLVNYISQNQFHWSYWAFNGTQAFASGRDENAAEYYGILAPDWNNWASAPLQTKLQSIM